MDKKMKMIVSICTIVGVVLIGIIMFFLLSNNKRNNVTFDTDEESYISIQGENEDFGKKYMITFSVDGETKTIEVSKFSQIDFSELGFEEKEGYVLKWYVNGEEFYFTDPLTTDMFIEGKYEEVTSYTVEFNSDGGTAVNSQTIDIGGKATEPENVTKEGFILEGWYLNDEKYDFNDIVTANIILTAKWIEISSIQENEANTINNNLVVYTITFNSDGGSNVPSQTVLEGGKVIKPVDPIKSGYIFKEWQLNGISYNFDAIVNENITLTAIWNLNLDVPIYLDGTINNKYFNITMGEINNREIAVNNTIGINDAIEYAHEHNIKNIKLQQGVYVVESNNEELTIVDKSKKIYLTSDMNFNLNKSTLKVFPNEHTRYSIFFVSDVKNVKIYNGSLKGDRDLHSYIDGKSSEYGMGIYIIHSQNIEISNMEMSDMTGDGVYITDLMYSKFIRTSNINILNNHIYNCRRNGISVVAVDKLNILNNIIHDIKGVNPQVAIDLERNKGRDKGNLEQFIKNVKIKDNQLYNCGRRWTVSIHGGVYNLEIINNELGNKLHPIINDTNPKDFPIMPIDQLMSEYNIVIKDNKVINIEGVNVTVNESNVNTLY